MKLAIVTVRYGDEILGGAEQAVRMLGEHLTASLGWRVEVFTTCALDAVTWENHYGPGTSEHNGVIVHRFRSVAGRHRSFERLSSTILADPARASAADAEHWLDLQGPVCPDLVDAVTASDADAVVMTPYLYWPTVHAMRRLTDARTAVAHPARLLHPAAHDEAPIKLACFAATFEGADGMIFYTDAERQLVEQLFPSTVATPQLCLGLGIDTAGTEAADPAEFRGQAGLGSAPYMLCLGRVDKGKGTETLARFFMAYKRRRPGPLQLVFAGPVVHPPPQHPDIRVTGPLDEAHKWGALTGAVLLVSPSPNESFSLVLLEAWLAGTPVLVNGRCPATIEHVRRSGGGLAFDSYAAFEAILDRMLGDEALSAALAARGRRYVQETFSWPSLTPRYAAFVENLVGHLVERA